MSARQHAFHGQPEKMRKNEIFQGAENAACRGGKYHE